MPVAPRKPCVGGHKRRTDSGPASVFPSGGRPSCLPCLVLKTLHFLVCVSPYVLCPHLSWDVETSSYGVFPQLCTWRLRGGVSKLMWFWTTVCVVSCLHPTAVPPSPGGWGPPVCGLGASLAALGVSHHTPLPAQVPCAHGPTLNQLSPMLPPHLSPQPLQLAVPKGPLPYVVCTVLGAFFLHPGPGPRPSEPPVTRRWELCHLCPDDTDLKTCCRLQLASP